MAKLCFAVLLLTVTVWTSRATNYTNEIKDCAHKDEYMIAACPSKDQGIVKSFLCDGNDDCEASEGFPGGEDEDIRYCKDYKCQPGQFDCGIIDGKRQCIPLSKRCDKKFDCKNIKDEFDCPRRNYLCKVTYKSGDSHVYRLGVRCDGIEDCDKTKDEETNGIPSLDEQNCEGYECNTLQFKCNDNKCLALHKRCDCYKDCKDGEDEIGCGEGYPWPEWMEGEIPVFE